MKPRLRRIPAPFTGRWTWCCVGLGVFAYGPTPIDAYFRWDCARFT